MFSKAIIVCALLALASARQFRLTNYLKKDIIVSVIGFEDVEVSVNQTKILELPDVIHTNLTAVYADCQDKACYEAQTTFTLNTGIDAYNYPEDRYEIDLSGGFNLALRAIPVTSMFCQQLNCFNYDVIKECPAQDSVLLNGDIVGCKSVPEDTPGCWPTHSSCRWYSSYNIFFEFQDME